ncbi:MAG: hypothetical protein P4L55_22500, partial [Syntrophobacteraceae bacterium]|nr:hypothetical protein [Syntrophobacteraceae bacterium]
TSRPADSPRSVTLRERPQLHVERAINMSDTFQSDRSARLILAYQRHRGNSFLQGRETAALQNLA